LKRTRATGRAVQVEDDVDAALPRFVHDPVKLRERRRYAM
jgi:hypothetical protein